MKSLIFTALFLMTSAALASEESYEACTPEGPCMIRVEDSETGSPVYLVTEKSAQLQLIWGDNGEFWLVSAEEYALVRDLIPEAQRFTVPAKDPTSGLTLMEAKKGGSTGTTGGTTPGPLVTGSINVNVSTGGGNCSDCHKGSHYDIHKQVLKPQGGK